RDLAQGWRKCWSPARAARRGTLRGWSARSKSLLPRVDNTLGQCHALLSRWRCVCSIRCSTSARLTFSAIIICFVPTPSGKSDSDACWLDFGCERSAVAVSAIAVHAETTASSCRCDDCLARRRAMVGAALPRLGISRSTLSASRYKASAWLASRCLISSATSSLADRRYTRDCSRNTIGLHIASSRSRRRWDAPDTDYRCSIRGTAINLTHNRACTKARSVITSPHVCQPHFLRRHVRR